MSDSGKKFLFKEKYLFEDESILIDHYRETCAFFITDCKKNWEIMDTIFNKSQQPKSTLVQMVFEAVFNPYITNVLKHYLSQKQDRFSDMFFKIHNETNEMLKSIWALDGSSFNNQNITENTFRPFQYEYERIENLAVATAMSTSVAPVLTKLRAIIENSKKWLSKRDEENYDIFSEFNPQLPITILTVGASAWEQCIVLSDPSKKHQILKNLIDIIIQGNLRDYLITYLDACRICMQKDNDVSIVPKFFAITSVINITILTIEAKYNQILKPVLQQKPIYHDAFLKERDSLVNSLEEGITKNLEICISTIVDKVKNIVSTKTFKQSFLRQNVLGSIYQPCPEICQILTGPNSIYSESQSLSGENNISFCSVLCKELIDTIINALLELKYDFPEGTMQLSMDICEYSNAFAKFNLDFVNSKFEDLDKAAKLMCTPADRISQIKKDLNMQPKAVDLARKLLPLRTDSKENDLVNAL